MTAASALAAWLHPALWLALPALLLAWGPDGLWAGLLAAVAPLLARCRSAAAPPGRAGSLLVAAMLAVAGLIVLANLVVAGDAAAWLGWPRWYGVAVSAAAAVVIAPVPGVERALPWLGCAALGSIAACAAAVLPVAAAAPLDAWARVAARPDFRFPPTSPWVTTGRALPATSSRRDSIGFEEEHRITAASRGVLRLWTQDGPRWVDREWAVTPGQSLTLRPGDWLEPDAVALRFEAGRRVPGSPPSGAAWARVGALDSAARLGLAATVLGGAVALLRPPRRSASRAAAAAVGLVLVASVLWAQAWAIYGALIAPEIFLGGAGVERALDLPAMVLAGEVGRQIVGLLLAGGLASFVASTIALRAAVARLGPAGAHAGRDRRLWTLVLGAAAVASLWPVSPWTLVVLALGLAASVVAPALLVATPPRPRAALAAALLGLAVFVGLALAGRLVGAPGAAAPVLAYPALVAMPAAMLLLRLWR